MISTALRRFSTEPAALCDPDYDVLSSSDLLLVGPPNCGRSSLLSAMLARHLSRGGRAITLYDAKENFLGRGAAKHVSRNTFDSFIDFDTTRWTTLNLHGFDFGADRINISRVLQFWVETHFEFSYSPLPLVLVIDDTAAWLSARLSQLLLDWFCGKDLLVWCAVRRPSDLAENALVERLADSRRKVLFPSSCDFEIEHSRCARQMAVELAQQLSFEKGKHVDVVISEYLNAYARRFSFHDVRASRVRLED